ncbi:hypothetical protein [Burkholderia stabilis]|nr:hypothetical protein [Burkholderia stabilis]
MESDAQLNDLQLSEEPKKVFDEAGNVPTERLKEAYLKEAACRKIDVRPR